MQSKHQNDILHILDLYVIVPYSIVILFMSYVSSIVQELSHPIHFNTSESHSHMFSSLFRHLSINQCKFHSISQYRSSTVNSKSFVGKVLF